MKRYKIMLQVMTDDEIVAANFLRHFFVHHAAQAPHSIGFLQMGEVVEWKLTPPIEEVR